MNYEDRLKKLQMVALKIPDGWESKKTYINDIENYVKFNLSEVTGSQVRNLFNAIDQKKTTEDLIMLIPDLKYAAGKKGTHEKLKKALIGLFIPIISKVDTEAKLNAFKDFNKSILCFHKYYENFKPNHNHGSKNKNSNNRRNSRKDGASHRGKQGGNRGRSPR